MGWIICSWSCGVEPWFGFFIRSFVIVNLGVEDERFVHLGEGWQNLDIVYIPMFWRYIGQIPLF